MTITVDRTNPVTTRPTNDELTWAPLAACRRPGANPEWWFPGPAELTARRTAIAICRGCPVRRACLDEALRHQDEYGIRGGLNPHQRRTLLARGRAA